ncbi:aldo/keto reductase [Pararhodobacter aggregans]|uniref:Aldo/keto reductase n=1 Tax=Pararhodobacter aggregans TaxID=404875 RepID=A0A2T7UJL7_9RHOB|nr:aldo/keto reductase [Pararhodobacter aggregans]PTX02261.1 aryl-alcohol dehydrogenase-like predicted oxidoreductase [Pararhodobacter aggregans]PVE44859.1 aldo/keto reductase [Pararhodobacter aggregans]
MQKRVLGSSGIEVSAVGYGAMSFSDFYGPTSEAASHAILDLMRDEGVNHLDTSNVYGNGRSEQWIGSYLAKNPGARADFVIATKAGISRDAEGARKLDNDPAHLEGELDKSLKRMGVDHVDLFYVHRREAGRPIEEVAETLERLRRSGKTRAVGFSEIAPSSLRRAAAVTQIDAVQSEYSLATRSPELGLVQACAELGAALVAFSPVGRSILTDDPIRPEQIETVPFLKVNPRFAPGNHQANLALTDGLRALAAEMGEPTAALANAWLLSRGAHILPIPGTRSIQHFRECLRGAALTLTEADLARIEGILPVGWAHGDRYDVVQWIGPERYC